MTPYRICFVCLGNICRSPMAAAILRQRLVAEGLDGAVRVESAGTGGWHVGEGADRRAVAALARRGLDGRHVAQQFTPADFDRHDLVVALDASNQTDLLRLAPSAEARAKVRLLRTFDPAAGDHTDVPDPYYGTAADFDRVAEVVEAACDGLVAHARAAVAGSAGPR
jgi:protein-tyrosine phosphatase